MQQCRLPNLAVFADAGVSNQAPCWQCIIKARQNYGINQHLDNCTWQAVSGNLPKTDGVRVVYKQLKHDVSLQLIINSYYQILLSLNSFQTRVQHQVVKNYPMIAVKTTSH